MIFVKLTEDMGRAIYTDNEIKENEQVLLCELLIFTPEDTLLIEKTSLKYYAFRFNEEQGCMPLGLATLLNHSDNPNLSYQIVEHDNRPMLELRASRTIRKGEELFIDYRADAEDLDIDEYFAFKPLIEQ